MRAAFASISKHKESSVYTSPVSGLTYKTVSNICKYSHRVKLRLTKCARERKRML